MGKEKDAPPLDIPPLLTESQQIDLSACQDAMRSADSEFSSDQWRAIDDLGDLYIMSSGCIYKEEHAYVARWRGVREPITLIPAGPTLFAGRVHHELMSFAIEVSTY